MFPALKTKSVVANTTFNLVCFCLIIISKPLWAQEQSLPDKIETNKDALSTTAYVTPIKHNPLNLSKGYFEQGTFRHKNNKTFDSNPNYIFKAFGQLLHLVLESDSSFISKDIFGVFDDFGTHTEKKDLPIDDYLDCFYKGYVKGDNQSTVAVSLCHGMIGYIKTSFGSLLIEPANNRTDNSTSAILHKIWQHTGPIVRHDVEAPNTDLEEKQTSLVHKLQRNKRNSNPKSLTIELLVAADHTMKIFHGEKVLSYILTLISIASNVFADPSIGYTIKVKLTNFIELQHRQQYNSLNEFCYENKRKGYHFDAAVLLTRDLICNTGNCDTLGYAYLGSICQNNGCAKIRDQGLATAFTMAHEIGHMLGMHHDDEQQCLNMRSWNEQTKLNTMSSIFRNDAHPWSWSKCSRHFFSQLVISGRVSCLEDTPKNFISNPETRLPGEIYSLDHQCDLKYPNKNSKHYHTNGVSPCQRLDCLVTGYIHYGAEPWADGSPCNGNQFWCQKSKCVPRKTIQTGPNVQADAVIDGGWGHWSPWDQCHGGIQISQRECNNPSPANGGKDCTGQSKRQRACNTQNNSNACFVWYLNQLYYYLC